MTEQIVEAHEESGMMHAQAAETHLPATGSKLAIRWFVIAFCLVFWGVAIFLFTT